MDPPAAPIVTPLTVANAPISGGGSKVDNKNDKSDKSDKTDKTDKTGSTVVAVQAHAHIPAPALADASENSAETAVRRFLSLSFSHSRSLSH